MILLNLTREFKFLDEKLIRCDKVIMYKISD